MKNAIIYALLMVASIVAACGGKVESEDHSHEGGERYTCPMHPQIVQDKPGTCPICKMDLVLVTNTTTDTSISLSKDQIALANIKTLKVGEGSFSTSKVLVGRLAIDPGGNDVISSRVQGRVEKLFVRESGQRLARGAAIMQVFSEELIVLQRDYLLQLKQVAEFPAEPLYKRLRDAAKNKLRLFGLSEAQLVRVARSGKPERLVTIYAGSGGIVREIAVSEGQYVAEGSPVLTLENLRKLWVEAELYPSELNLVRTGSLVRVDVPGFPELSTNARVEFISPELDPSSQRLKIRASMPNQAGNLQPGMQVNVLLRTGSVSKAIKLPLTAVIRDEKGALVWVRQKDNVFSAKEVETGAEDASQIIITSGLAAGEEVVVEGAYLLNSEFILKKVSSI